VLPTRHPDATRREIMTALLADGVYIGGGAIVLILIIIVIVLLLRRRV
jgi:hypothetical protein